MLPPRAEPRRSCHEKRAGSGASVRRSRAAEKQYPQPTRGSWSGLQAVGGSEACIPEIQECGAPDRSRLQRNATSHADRHGHGCPSVPATQHCGGADHGRPPPLATNSSIERTRAAASLASPGLLPSDKPGHASPVPPASGIAPVAETGAGERACKIADLRRHARPECSSPDPMVPLSEAIAGRRRRAADGLARCRLKPAALAAIG